MHPYQSTIDSLMYAYGRHNIDITFVVGAVNSYKLNRENFVILDI